VRERETERDTGCQSVRVMGAKRLRRSRWERGTYERVAQGGVRPMADAGGYITRIEMTIHVIAQKAARFWRRFGYMDRER
jgi:hypothetical protein